MEYAFRIQGAIESAPQPQEKPKSANARECRAFYGLAGKTAAQGQNEVTLFVQLGFFDDPHVPRSLSVDPQIADNLIGFLKYCGFTEKTQRAGAQQVFESVQGSSAQVKSAIRIVLGRASKDGRYDPAFSKEALARFHETLSHADYLITIGHSRNGRGLDLFAASEHFKNTIPVYSKEFLEKLSTHVKGAALLGCDSQKYLSHVRRRDGHTPQLVDFRGPFYSEGSIGHFFDALEELR